MYVCTRVTSSNFFRCGSERIQNEIFLSIKFDDVQSKVFQGLPDVIMVRHTKTEKYTSLPKWYKNIPNFHKICQIAINIKNFIPRPSKIYLHKSGFSCFIELKGKISWCLDKNFLITCYRHICHITIENQWKLVIFFRKCCPRWRANPGSFDFRLFYHLSTTPPQQLSAYPYISFSSPVDSSNVILQ
jgi:hypothetical protein